MTEQILDKMSNLMTSAFGLVAALAWNDAIKALFAKYYAKGEGIGAQFVYASIVTIVAVVAAVWIGRVAAKVKEVTGAEEGGEASAEKKPAS
ncbi:MAG: hypothetical protein EP343_02120 [Deltaproteobacteria bacterium]|nr:MAG: hypothetical protein EP343_02120 [Deltaproteobacteria bacterium]